MHRLANRLYYLTETLLTRSPIYQLMLVAGVILLLSLGGGIFVHFTNPGAYANTLEAIWWAFLRLTDPGYLGDDRGFFPRLISTFLTLAGYVVFLGALVALMTNWLDRSLKFLASGRSPIFEQGHVLIIGWNERIHALIEEVVHTNERFKRHEKNSSIVILCDPYQPEMHRELMQKLDPGVREKCQVLIRSGNPLEAESLERVDFANARAIILISTASSVRSQRALSDVTLAKVLMSMKALTPDIEEPPNVVVEVANSGNKLLLESVGWRGRTEAVVADDIMGRLFCQAIRFPGISHVYHRLLTDTFGYTIVLQRAGELGLTGKPLVECVTTLRSGTPVGYLRESEGQKGLHLLHLHETLNEEDLVVLVVSSEAREISEANGSEGGRYMPRESRGLEGRILVIGWSTDLFTFLTELCANEKVECRATLVWETDRPTERSRLEELEQNTPNLKLEFHQSSLIDHNALERMQLENYSKVLLLADQNQEPLVADAENVLRYVLLQRLLEEKKHQADIVVELNDEDNRPLLAGGRPDVLMTGEILSHLLAQVSTHRSLMWIYEELFTKGGAELRLRKPESLDKTGIPFRVCQQTLLEENAVALGYCRGDEVVFNPPSDLKLRPDDRVILVEME